MLLSAQLEVSPQSFAVDVAEDTSVSLAPELRHRRGRYNFRNGTERRNGTTAFRSGFYKNMIIHGTERVAFRLLQESYNFRNGTERLRSGFYKNMIIYGTERSVAWIIISVTAERNDLRLVPDFTRI